MTDGNHTLAGNVMLEDTYERHVLGDLYADERLGLYVIRGENMVLLGELVKSTFPSKTTKPLILSFILLCKQICIGKPSALKPRGRYVSSASSTCLSPNVHDRWLSGYGGGSEAGGSA